MVQCPSLRSIKPEDCRIVGHENEERTGSEPIIGYKMANMMLDVSDGVGGPKPMSRESISIVGSAAISIVSTLEIRAGSNHILSSSRLLGPQFPTYIKREQKVCLGFYKAGTSSRWIYLSLFFATYLIEMHCCRHKLMDRSA